MQTRTITTITASLAGLLLATAAAAEGTRIFGDWIVDSTSLGHHPEAPHFPEQMTFHVRRNDETGSTIVIDYPDGFHQHDLHLALHGIESTLPGPDCRPAIDGQPGTVLVYRGVNRMHSHDDDAHRADHEVWARFFFDPWDDRNELCFDTQDGNEPAAGSKHVGEAHSHEPG